MKIKIEQSPYGDTGKTYDGILGMMNHFVLQLESFRSPNKTAKESKYLEADIRGYKEILKSGKESNALKFLEIKRHPDTFKEQFANNELLVEHMKKNGMWE